MNRDSIMRLYIADTDITMEEEVDRVLGGEISKEEFWERWYKLYRYRRLCEECWENDLETLDWKELEKRGHLCKNDYEDFELTKKYGMTPEEGERIFDEELNKRMVAGVETGRS